MTASRAPGFSCSVTAVILSPTPPARAVLRPSLLALWDFQEPAGAPRIAKHGLATAALGEHEGPIARVAAPGAPFGPCAARIARGQWFSVPRARLGALDIHGADAQVSVVAWVLRESPEKWQAIAGVWDETRRKRQYGMFINAHSFSDARTLQRFPCDDRLHGHMSSVGGPTPGHDFCVTYASTDGALPLGAWLCLGVTYDGREIRAYVNGRLDDAAHANPFPYPGGLFDGGADGADFTVGANSAGGAITNFFGGLIGGLAVYREALDAETMHALAQTP